MSLLRSAARGLKTKSRGFSGSGMGSPWHTEGVDYNVEAGRRIDSSIVYSILGYAVRQMRKAPIVVKRPGPDRKLVIVEDHPITNLLQRPVPWMSGSHMQALWLTCELARGNSYTYVHRNGRSGIIEGLEVLPMGTCWPYTSPSSGEFIDEYRLGLVSGEQAVSTSFILHQRWFTADPVIPQLGLGPLEAVLPEIAMDKRSGRYEYGLLNNGGRSPAIISPPSFEINGQKIIYTDEQKKQMEALLEERTSGDNVGRPLISPIPVSLQQYGFKPSEMSLEQLRNVPEERICAAVGIPPLCIGLGAGLDAQSDRASSETVERMALLDFTLPYMEHRGEQLTAALVPELGQDGDVVCYDVHQIPLYRKLLAEENEMDAGGPTDTVNEIRARKGLGPIDGGNTVRQLGGGGQRVQVVDDAKPRK